MSRGIGSLPLAAPDLRPRRDRQRGVALLVVIAWLALMIALIAEFSYGTSVDAAQAANARDELRAHYLARSSIAVSRLLIKIQQRFIDPVMAQAQQMLAQAGGGNLGVSLKITDYAGPIMGLFGGTEAEVGSLVSLIGIDVTGVKGLGLSSGRFDGEITAEDGKIDLNCGSGLPSAEAKQKQLTVYRLLTAMMFSPRYDALFGEPDAQGQIVDRDGVARALIDWADTDDQMFSPEGGSGSEDYRYDARSDPYRAHDNSYDTVEESALVRGVREPFLEAFQPHLTVYASDPQLRCRVNLAALERDCAPIMMGVLRAAAVPDLTKPPSDPAVLDDRILYPLATILCERAAVLGFDNLDTVVNVLGNPQAAVTQEDPRYPLLQAARAITISRAALERVAYVGSPRVYRIVATGESGRVKKKITAIVDTGRMLDNPVTNNPASEKASGVLQYWREE